MLNALLLLLAVVTTRYCIKSTGFFSPASLSASFSLVSMILFLGIYWFPSLSSSSGLSFDIGRYDDVSATVVIIYAAFIVLTGLAVSGLSPPSSTAFHEATITFVRSSAARLIKPFALVLVIVTAIDVAALAAVGLESATGDALVSALSGPISAAAACAIAFGFEAKNRAYLLLLPVLAVHFALMLIAYSRWTGVVCALIAMLMVNRRLSEKKSGLSIGPLLMAALAVWMHVFALQGRVDRGSGFDMGLVVQHLASSGISRDALAGMGINIFQGPLCLAETLQIGKSSYDLSYKVLSFSPFPSFIDNWKSVQPLANRINPFTPYSAFGELFNFGAPYMVLFAAIYVKSIRTLTKVYMTLGAEVGFLLVSPAIIPLLTFHQYPIRNSLRIFLFTTLFAYVLSRRIEQRLRAVAAAGPETRRPDISVA